MWESRLYGSERDSGSTAAWLRYCGTAGKLGGNRENKLQPAVAGDPLSTRHDDHDDDHDDDWDTRKRVVYPPLGGLPEATRYAGRGSLGGQDRHVDPNEDTP